MIVIIIITVIAIVILFVNVFVIVFVIVMVTVIVINSNQSVIVKYLHFNQLALYLEVLQYFKAKETSVDMLNKFPNVKKHPYTIFGFIINNSFCLVYSY